MSATSASAPLRLTPVAPLTTGVVDCTRARQEQINKRKNSVALSPQANHTDRSTATCRRNLVPSFEDRGVLRDQRGGSLTVVNLSFLDRARREHR
jgi:hypothetical protein